MSLVTVSKKRKRVYPRKFDHDEAQTLHLLWGWSVTTLAAHYGVTWAAVKRVVDPATKLRMYEQSLAFLMSGECRACGRPCNRRPREKSTDDGYKSSGLCRRCWGESKQTRFRFDELGNLAAIRCSTCKTWKDAGEFSSHKRNSRSKYGQCRSCGTKARQNYRERHKEPCVDCGARALPAREKLTGGAKFPRCRACYVAWTRLPENREASRRRSQATHR